MQARIRTQREFLRTFFAILVLYFSNGATAAGQTDQAVLDRLTALLGSPKYEDHVAASYCIADFDMDGKLDYAFGTVTDNPEFGAYFIQLGDRLIELANHNIGPALQCLDTEEARKRNDFLQSSEGLLGGIKSGGTATIVCGFVSETEAICWGYDKSSNGFVVVGGWIT